MTPIPSPPSSAVAIAPPLPTGSLAVEMLERLEFQTVRDLVIARAALGAKPFMIVDDDRVLTYEQAHEQSNRVANALTALGVAPGDVVATLLHNSVEQALVWFACAKLGAIWAPLNVALVGADLEWTANNTAARVLVVGERTLEAFAAVRDRLDNADVVALVGSDSAARAAGALPFGDLLTGADSTPAFDAEPSTPTTITYSGGSTGMPKGILLPNRYCLASGIRFQTIAQATPADVNFCFTQLFHSGGQFNGLIGPMYSGMTTVMSSWFSASATWKRVREHGTTIMDPFAAVIMILLKQPPSPFDRGERTLIGVGTGTGQIPWESRCEFEERFNVALHEVYGQTETGLLSISERPGERRPRSSGRTYGWLEISIRDANDDELPVGDVGEIAVRPVHAHTFMTGYHNNPAVTASCWRNLWHHTADLGRLDEDGYLYFLGRKAHWMRRRGENVSAYEVESAILQHPAISEVVVVGVPAELGDEEIKAYLVLTEDSREDFDFANLVEWCQQNLAYFKVPRYYELVDGFERTAAKGEPPREALRAAGIGAAWDREVAAPGPR